jgi:hypothetical protein
MALAITDTTTTKANKAGRSEAQKLREVRNWHQICDGSMPVWWHSPMADGGSPRDNFN